MPGGWTVLEAGRHWIDLPSSMTREIERVLSTPQVRVFYEGPDRVSPWEARLLGMSPRGRAYAREIGLMVNGKTVMLARSLAALDDPVVGVLRRLRRAPLADVLFGDARWRRRGSHVPLRWRHEGQTIPGRAWLWEHAGGRGQVLVEEFFLPRLTARSPLQ